MSPAALPPMTTRYTWRDFVQMALFTLLVKPFLTFCIGLRVRGAEHLPRTDPFLLIANHSSHLDTLALLSLFPLSRLRHIHPVAAADYFERNKVVSLITRTACNILPIARRDITTDNDPIPRMIACLQAGKSLILFPEGTRGSGAEMGPFRSGVARVLEHVPHVPVVPAYLVNMGRSLPKGEYIPVPFFCEVRLGVPQQVQGNRHEVMQALEGAVRQLAGESSA
ncbi:MAG: 1-acyl-sn-glycerol-3-phosphate acyltransferase [Candidatus Tectomicrobia bacterium]|uniref:1-acyl-sn-glycerol-3-phosphate acyltransferase n=1 Tax=Tectimicrobiota bacterium TaxID=2528274 RepID=A0A938B3M3_UNCTE|nr:1-acyl-sn-glycerol-3-phosphate acyltransferase [Candidatus Tectomicrobia bacterium]